VATVGGAALAAAEMELAKAKAGEWQGVRKIKASVEQKHVEQARR